MFRLPVQSYFYLLIFAAAAFILVFFVHLNSISKYEGKCVNQTIFVTVPVKETVVENSVTVKNHKQLHDSVLKNDRNHSYNVPAWDQVINFTNFDNESGTVDGHYIVPNYVHFIKFGESEFSFAQAICVLAALKHQKPAKLFIHTDVKEFKGKYWDVLSTTDGFREILVIEKLQLPKTIFHQPLRKSWARYHGGDVARMRVLMKYGGIYLDNDSYVVRSLNDFRRYEFTLGWKFGKSMGNQIILCHKDARFLKLWYESYRDNYKPKQFYYNAGVYPAYHILKEMPYLVHRVDKLFGNYGIKKNTYLTKFPEWRDYYALHLLANRLYGLRNLSENATYPVKFDDQNV